MSIPDQSHIDQVCEALWQRSGGASVMIGSGFSRNAQKSRPDPDDPPTWREMAKALSDKLYPQDNGSDTSSRTAATNDFLKLAQEYEAAFGRGDLHRFIQKLIRDEDFKPGDIHTRLLRLPWRDVFTTNWDTLLERARSFVADLSYSVIRNVDEISLAVRPRIVKLHGSLPAYFPLIFTEEDYRTYPRKFAPFVNTVQQAMMETVFCLIGFSSDDPNFLQWSGWVRDNLGESAPKIYLAGWLNLSPHRRRMLEERNIVPIDLARHPKSGEWPEHQRHQYATEWILHSLERGRPYEISEWPSRSDWQLQSIPEELQPVKEIVPNEPKEEPRSPSESGNESGDLSEQVKECLKIWAHNRRIYPGWLVVPTSTQYLMSWRTDKWESPILDALPGFAPLERLKAIGELVWRREIMLDPISPELETSAQEALEEIDCQTRTIKGVADPNIDWTNVRETWRTVALALVTVARFRFDEDLFEKRIAALSPFRNDHPDVAQRIHHERCLWAIYALDFKKLDDLLKDWQTKNCDPVWMLRKAAILVEMNRTDDTIGLLNHALSSIRAIPRDECSVAGPSREGWALWMALAFERERENPLQNRIGALPAFMRWRELTSLKCNALVERHDYADAIRGHNDKKEKLPFDLGHRYGPVFRISNEERDRQVAAYRAIRLSEVAGLPPSANSLVLASNILDLAADRLFLVDPEMAVLLVLRFSHDGENLTFTRVLSRTQVASMPGNSVRRLVQACNNAIEYALPRIAGGRQHAIFWIERLRVALEALSRLVLRSGPEMAEAVFDKALEYYRNDHVVDDWWLEKPIHHILKRSWETLPKDRQTSRVLDLLSAPIVGMDGLTASSERYPEPGELIQDELSLPTRTPDNERRWQEIVSLLIRALNTGGEARKRASIRIIGIAKKRLLSDAETSQVAQALWSSDHTEPNDLPGGTNLYEWVFLPLPQPQPGLAEQRFRHKWLDIDKFPQRNGADLDELLWQIGSAISGLNVYQQPLTLSDREQNYLAGLVRQWAESPPVRKTIFFDHQDIDRVRRAIFGLKSILLKVLIPEATATKLYEKIHKLKGSDTPGLELIAGIVRALPNRFDEIVLLVRTELTSDNSASAERAAWGLHFWLKAASDSTHELRPPPDDLVHEIGIIIATRRKVVLAQALQIAKWIFAEGNKDHRKIIGQLAVQGLGYLLNELRYDREHQQDEDFDVPLLRWDCTHLAIAMAEHGFGDDPTVARWLDNAKEDPLPEVRHAQHPTFTHQREGTTGPDNGPTSQTE